MRPFDGKEAPAVDFEVLTASKVRKLTADERVWDGERFAAPA